MAKVREREGVALSGGVRDALEADRIAAARPTSSYPTLAISIC